MGQSAPQPSRLLRGAMFRIEMETTVAAAAFGTVQPSLLAPHTHVAPSHMEQLIHGFVLNPEPAHESGIGPVPRVTQDLIYVGPASSEVWLGNDKRLRGRRGEEESERREGGRKPGL